MWVTVGPRRAESHLGRTSSSPPRTSMRTPLLPAWRGTPGASDHAVGFLKTKSPTPVTGGRSRQRQRGSLLAPAQVAGLDGDGPNAREGQRGATTISSFSEEALRGFEVRNRALAVPEPECGGAQHIRRLRSFR